MKKEDKLHLKKYLTIIDDYVKGKISVEEFEKKYLKVFKTEEHAFDKNIFFMLADLFSSVDTYCGDVTIANHDKNYPFHDIDEKDLLKEVKTIQEKLIISIEQ